jgi:predicted MPP superfamily phosphohydrolase
MGMAGLIPPWPITIALGGVAVFALLALWALWIEPSGLRNDTTTLSLPGWPDGSGELTIALIADLHIGSPHNNLDRLDRVVKITNDARPDLILLAGDFVINGVRGGRFVPPEPIAERLAGLFAPLGVYAVLGNHDWWFDGPRVRAALEHNGIRVLVDEAIKLESGGRGFWLAGVGDLWETSHDMAAALDQVSDADPVLLVTHNPDLFSEVPDRVALTLAGHTHGGQVRIPGIGRPIVPSRFGDRYAAGHVVEGGRHLFVTPGVGTSMLPVRLLVPPEVSVLRLR